MLTCNNAVRFNQEMKAIKKELRYLLDNLDFCNPMRKLDFAQKVHTHLGNNLSEPFYKYFMQGTDFFLTLLHARMENGAAFLELFENYIRICQRWFIVKPDTLQREMVRVMASTSHEAALFVIYGLSLAWDNEDVVRREDIEPQLINAVKLLFERGSFEELLELLKILYFRVQFTYVRTDEWIDRQMRNLCLTQKFGECTGLELLAVNFLRVPLSDPIEAGRQLIRLSKCIDKSRFEIEAAKSREKVTLFRLEKEICDEACTLPTLVLFLKAARDLLYLQSASVSVVHPEKNALEFYFVKYPLTEQQQLFVNAPKSDLHVQLAKLFFS